MAQNLQSSKDVVNIEFGLSIAGHTIDLGGGNVTLGGAFPGFKKETTIHMSPNLRNEDTNLLGTLEAHELWHAKEGRQSDSILEETEAYKFQYWTGVMLGIPGNDSYTPLAASFKNTDLSPTNPNLRNEFTAARDALKGASGSAGVMYGHLPNQPQRGFVKEWQVIVSMGLDVMLGDK